MGAEVLLYGYGLVCISMLVFNLLYSLHLRAGQRRMMRRMAVLRRRVEAQLRGIQNDLTGQNAQSIQVKHLTWLRRRLSRVSYLLAFDRFLDEQDGRDRAFQTYIRQIQPVFLYLATVYWKREDTQAAYFCHFLARHRLQRHMEMDQIQQAVLSYLKKDSLYCKVNALKALCSFANPEILTQSLLELGREANVQLHPKVVTEALLTYTGDAEALIRRILGQLDHFSLQIQRAVLDYIRFRSGAYGQPMAEILRDPGRDKELRFAAIRYFGRYPDPSVEEILLRFVTDKDPLRWEYAAISASALARYPGQEVVDALIQAMYSPNWYIRYNASSSLEAHGLSYEALFQILSGEDRYAREMLNYRLETRRLEERAAAAQAPPRQERVGAAV